MPNIIWIDVDLQRTAKRFGKSYRSICVMTIDNKHKILIGLALILTAMLTYRALNPFRQPTVSKLTYGRASKIISPGPKVAAGHTLGRPTKIKTELLMPPPRLELQVYRDPFRRPQQAKAVPPPKPADRKPAPRIVTPDERAREALRRFKAFGSFRQDDRASLFLQRGKQVLIVTAGDRIDGKFMIEAIDGRTVVVSTSEMTAPFQFEFEELKPADDSHAGRASASTVGASPATRRPALATSSANASEGGEESPIPPLPEPPPIDEPAPPPSSSGSPSRNYLPGNKPPDALPETNDRITSESEEENPIPPLPEPPPVDGPAPPPSSKESPSRNYLPGNKPPE